MVPRRQGLIPTPTAQPRFGHLSDIFGQLKCKRTSTTATTDNLQPLTVRGHQIISEKQRHSFLELGAL